MRDHGKSTASEATELRRLAAAPADSELWAEGQRWMADLQGILTAANLPVPDNTQSDRLTRAFCCSRFVAKVLTIHPEWVEQVCAEPLLRQPFAVERLSDFNPLLHDASDDLTFMRWLRILRQREMTRIALRDLYGWADLQETMAALSMLADFCIRAANDRAYQLQCNRHGPPLSGEGELQSMVVLAMGKLGGQELNFSSDIDLVFAYPETGETQASAAGQRRIDNQSFFMAQAQALIRYLNEMTADGFVFRVDARLRPFGDSGALVVSFSFMESYYQHQGRDWERYAMIKARPVAGLVPHQNRLEKLLQPFVYRRYLDYGAFNALRDMKALILREVERKGLQGNIKLGSGGIREIEFIGQAFQLIRGGRDPDLRGRQILAVLAQLAEKGLMAHNKAQVVLAAYHFLRDTENRLQMVDDRQTHSLPKNSLECQRLAYAMGFEDWPSFEDVLQQHQTVVSECFQDVFFPQEAGSVPDQPNQCQVAMQQMLDGRLSEADALTTLNDCGFANAEALYSQLRGFIASHTFKHITPLARNRLSKLMPIVLSELSPVPSPEQTLGRVLNLFQAVIQRPVYLVLLIEYPGVLKQVIKLFSASSWIADYLARQPILLDSLLDTEQLYSVPGRDDLLQELQRVVASQVKEDPEQRLNALRHFKHEQTLRVAVVDVNEQLPLMKISDQLTWLAEAILDQTCALAWEEQVSRYGPPGYRAEGTDYTAELAVVGYGKLGGIELGYGSDLDIVLLHNSSGETQETRGERVIDNQSFFSRVAQRLVYWLATPTMAGVLYETDLRLRPDGASGMLVSSLERFQQYQAERAWIWEHQALVRARMVVGSPTMRAEFEAIRHKVLTRKRDLNQLRTEVRNMRERMRKEVAKSRIDEFDLKFDRGGLGDIEFLVQFGVLAWAHEYPDLTRYTDNIRILEQFRDFGLLEHAEADCLIETYLELRAQIHRRALSGESAVVGDADVAGVYVEQVAKIWSRHMENDD